MIDEKGGLLPSKRVYKVPKGTTVIAFSQQESVLKEVTRDCYYRESDVVGRSPVRDEIGFVIPREVKTWREMWVRNVDVKLYHINDINGKEY